MKAVNDWMRRTLPDLSELDWLTWKEFTERKRFYNAVSYQICLLATSRDVAFKSKSESGAASAVEPRKTKVTDRLCQSTCRPNVLVLSKFRATLKATRRSRITRLVKIYFVNVLYAGKTRNRLTVELVKWSWKLGLRRKKIRATRTTYDVGRY